MREIVEDFRQLRQTDESLRDSVRRNAQESLIAIKWQEEQRFYIVLSHYFLRAWQTPQTDDGLDSEARLLVKVGGRDAWPTPSSAVYAQLRQAATPIEVVEILKSERKDLIERWSEVTVRYQAVLRALVMET